jgi:drug/metabolite transporter (DMT)-like permease
MSVVAPITGVCGLASPVCVGLILGEKLGTGALVGIVLSVSAIVLISRDAGSSQTATASEAREGQASARRYVLMAVGAGVALGFFFITLAQTKPEAGLWPLVAARSVTTACYFAVALFTKQSLRIPARARHIALIGGALDICANSLYLLSVRGGLLSLAATVTSLYPATTVVLASLVLKEKIGRTQAFGLVCATLAVLLITAT